MVKFSNYIFRYFEFGICFAPLLHGIQQSRKKHKNRASCRFVSSTLTHCWVSNINQTHTTLANSAYLWFLAHAISAVGTRSLQPERTQRTTANTRRKTLRAQSFSRTFSYSITLFFIGGGPEATSRPTPLFWMEPCIFFNDIITDFKTNSATYNTRPFYSRKVWK